MTIGNSVGNVRPIRPELPPTDRLRQHRRRWPIVLAIVVAICPTGYVGYQLLFERYGVDIVPAARLTISTVTSGPFVESISLRGQVLPAITVSIAPEMAARIDQVLAKSGTIVSAGTPLVRLTSPAFELELLSRQVDAIAQINNQKSMQISARSKAEETQRDLAGVGFRIEQLTDEISRLEPLVLGGSQTTSSLDKARQELTYQQSLENLLRHQAANDAVTVEEIRLSLQETTNLMAEINARRAAQQQALTVTAPISGMLNGLNLIEGQQVSEGETIGSVDATDTFKVVFLADEFFLPRVSVGQKIVADIDQSEHQMRVVQISPRVENGQFQIEAEFDEGALAPRLLRGQAIAALLITGQTDGATLSLPAGAYLEGALGQWVFRVADDGQAAKVPIVIGRRSSERVEILSGLREGDKVITSSYADYARHETFRIEEDKP